RNSADTTLLSPSPAPTRPARKHGTSAQSPARQEPAFYSSDVKHPGRGRQPAGIAGGGARACLAQKARVCVRLPTHGRPRRRRLRDPSKARSGRFSSEVGSNHVEKLLRGFRTGRLLTSCGIIPLYRRGNVPTIVGCEAFRAPRSSHRPEDATAGRPDRRSERPPPTGGRDAPRAAAQKLQEMVRVTCTVVRGTENGNATESEIPIRELVPGDLVKLSAGDMVPADVRLLSAKDLFVTQSTLTGESLPVEKTAAPVLG